MILLCYGGSYADMGTLPTRDEYLQEPLAVVASDRWEEPGPNK